MLAAFFLPRLVAAQTGCTHASLTQTKAWPPTPNKHERRASSWSMARLARTVHPGHPLRARVATGGTPPYRYSLSGLPPGITFNAVTRVASGTLPVVSRNTTYRLTYSVTDSADADSFTATVVPPAN